MPCSVINYSSDPETIFAMSCSSFSQKSPNSPITIPLHAPPSDASPFICAQSPAQPSHSHDRTYLRRTSTAPRTTNLLRRISTFQPGPETSAHPSPPASPLLFLVTILLAEKGSNKPSYARRSSPEATCASITSLEHVMKDPYHGRGEGLRQTSRRREASLERRMSSSGIGWGSVY